MTNPNIESCEDALRMLAAHIDGELTDEAHTELERHLARCRSCYSRAEFERRLKEKVAEVGRAEVRPDLRARVQTLIERYTVADPSSD